MKQLLTVFLLVVSCQLLRAQAATAKISQHPVNLSDLTIKDSSGTGYPANIVQAMMRSGKYGVRLLPGGTEGYIYLLSEAEKSNREAAAPKPRESNFFTVGKAFSPFKERDMKGNKFNLKEMAGKVVVVNFWFINCPPCRMEIPDLNSVVEQYKDNKDVVFIAIATDQKYDLEAFLKTSPFNYNIIDNGQYLAQNYNVNLFPTHVVIDKQGKVLFHTSGLSSGTIPWLKKSIEAGLNNTTVK